MKIILFTIGVALAAILGFPEEALADFIITPIVTAASAFSSGVAAGFGGAGLGAAAGATLPAAAGIVVGTAASSFGTIGTAISTLATVGQVFGAVGQTAVEVQAAELNQAAALQEAEDIETQAALNADLAEREALEITQRAEFNALASERDASLAEQEAEFNAAASRLEAAEVAQEAIEAARVAKRKSKRILARQRAITGGRGIEVTSGSPLLLTIDSIQEARAESLGILGTARRGEGAKLLRAQLDKFIGKVQGTRFRSEAELIRFEGETGAIRARRGGDIELFLGRVEAGQARRRAAIFGLGSRSSIVTGVSRIGKIFA